MFCYLVKGIDNKKILGTYDDAVRYQGFLRAAGRHVFDTIDKYECVFRLVATPKGKGSENPMILDFPSFESAVKQLDGMSIPRNASMDIVLYAVRGSSRKYWYVRSLVSEDDTGSLQPRIHPDDFFSNVDKSIRKIVNSKRGFLVSRP